MDAANTFAHLGPAPYKFTGLHSAEDRLMVAQAAAEKQGFSLVGILDNHKPKLGTSCDHCGTYIENVYWFECADGAKFKTGETCANKILYAERAASAEQNYAARVAKSKMNKAKRQRKARIDAFKIARGLEFVEANRARLAAIPHPNNRRAQRGETLADSIDWMMKNAGVTGKMKAIRGAYKALGHKPGRVTAAMLAE